MGRPLEPGKSDGDRTSGEETYSRAAYVRPSCCSARGNPGRGVEHACNKSGGSERMKLVILGLSYTSSWGNGHATTYRGLVRELTARGHEVLFLERDMPWYAAHRDAPEAPSPSRVVLYASFTELRQRYTKAIREADAVIVG